MSNQNKIEFGLSVTVVIVVNREVILKLLITCGYLYFPLIRLFLEHFCCCLMMFSGEKHLYKDGIKGK